MYPRVSIIVPVYNVEKYLDRCIDSILLQTYTDFECILVDDYSPDSCPEMCDRYAKQDVRIKVVHKTQNEGLPLARKTGFENSSGEYIQFVDSDDWIEPDMIEKLYTAAVESGADIVTCDMYKYNALGNYSYEVETFDTDNNINNFGFTHLCSVCNKFFHRKIISRIDFPKAGKYEDRVITQQAFFYAKKITKVSYPLYRYFYNPESISRATDMKMYCEWRDNIFFVVDFLRNNLGENFSLREKHINNYVNKFKFKILCNKYLRQNKSLLTFYPESKFYSWLFPHLMGKIRLLFFPYGLFHQRYIKNLFSGKKLSNNVEV